MNDDIGSEKFMEFFATIIVGSKIIERDPNDFAKSWHPDLIKCMEIAHEKAMVGELRRALEHKLAALDFAEEGRHAEAIIQYREASDAFPEGPHFKFILALGLMGAEEYSEASALFKKFLLAKPNDWEAKYYLSRCHYMLNDVDSAIALLEDCIKTDYEPIMSLHMGIYCASKGESIGKQLYNQLGRYEQKKTAEMASPYFEKAINNFQQYKKNEGELDPQYFNKVCNMYDQLSPGRLQYMGIPLSLNRLHRVLSTCDDLPEPILDAEFVLEGKACSALVASCVRDKSSGRYQTTVALYETDDTDKILNKMAVPLALVTIAYPGLCQERPDVSIG